MHVTQKHEEKEYKTKEQPKKLNRYIEATASPEPVVKYVREREKIQPAFCAVFLNLFTILPTSSDTEYVHPTQHTSCNLDVHHDQGGNETVQTQDLGENQDQNHTDVQFWLLGSSSDTGVADDTNGKTSCQTR